ncbi:MAG: putative peptidoglycan glycosyltransferase FtsW [Candidatus Nealsonbacteria bacterium]
MNLTKAHHFDYSLMIIVGILLIIGILVLSSVSAVFSYEKFGSSNYYFNHQMIYGVGLGLLFGLFAYKLPLKFFKKFSWIFLFLNLLFMILVFIPGLGIVSGGAPRWMNLSFFTFQPSELLKLSFLIYIATWLSNRVSKRSRTKDKKKWKNTFLPFIFILGLISFLLYLQSDASTLALILAIGAILYFVSNTPLWHTFLLISIGVGGFFGLVSLVSYRLERIFVMLGLVDDPMGAGYHIKQALITIGSGGIVGLGIGMSSQKFGGLLPQTMSDSIFAIFAEETGFLGSLVLISLFLLFLWRTFRIAKNSKDKFSQLFSIGIGVWICIQAFINIGAMVKLLPLTGIPLPFIGYGGSHIAVELVGVAILLNISKQYKK